MTPTPDHILGFAAGLIAGLFVWGWFESLTRCDDCCRNQDDTEELKRALRAFGRRKEDGE